MTSQWAAPTLATALRRSQPCISIFVWYTTLYLERLNNRENDYRTGPKDGHLMTIDRKFLGYSLPTFTVSVTRERLALFRSSIGSGETDHDTAPPTFMKAIEGEDNSSRRILDALGVDLRRVLHAEQQFDYFEPIRSGDHLQVQRTVTDLYEKKRGAIEFIVIESTVSRDDGIPIGKSRQIVLVHNPAHKIAS